MTIQLASSVPLYKGNNHTARAAITVFDAGTGNYIPLAGGSVTARIAATPQGAALAGLGPTACSEAPTGTYAATFAAADLASLTNGDTVYQVIAVGTSAVLTTPLMVQPERYL